MNTIDESPFLTMEQLIAKKTEQVLNQFDYDVTFERKTAMYYVSKDFVSVGKFDFQYRKGEKVLIFELNVDGVQLEFPHLVYGLHIKEKHLAHFLDALKGNLSVFA